MNRPAPAQAALPLQSHQREIEVQRITEIREEEEPGNIYAAAMALPIGDAEVPIDTLADHDLSELLLDHTSFSEDTGARRTP